MPHLSPLSPLASPKISLGERITRLKDAINLGNAQLGQCELDLEDAL
jgi:hypothetical protein